MGDRNEPVLKGQTAVSMNVNNAKESMESFIKKYIFLKLDLLDISFWSESCGVFYAKKLLERKRTKIQTNIELKMVNN